LVACYAVAMAIGTTAFASGPWWGAVFQLVFWLVATPIVVRYGFTVMATTAFVFLMINNLPTTLDPGQWYFSTSVGGYAVLAALIAYGAYICLAGTARGAAD
jgi:hypothetical protein